MTADGRALLRRRARRRSAELMQAASRHSRSSWVYFCAFSKPWSTMSPVMMPSETISRSSASEDAASRSTLMTLCPSSMRECFQDRERVRIALGVKNGIAFLQFVGRLQARGSKHRMSLARRDGGAIEAEADQRQGFRPLDHFTHLHRGARLRVSHQITGTNVFDLTERAVRHRDLHAWREAALAETAADEACLRIVVPLPPSDLAAKSSQFDIPLFKSQSQSPEGFIYSQSTLSLLLRSTWGFRSSRCVSVSASHTARVIANTLSSKAQ